MADFFGKLSRDDVNSPEDYATYCQQVLGTPYPSGKQLATLRRNLKEFFKNNPQATYGTLLRTIDWCRNRKRRPAHCYAVIPLVRYAWSDGYLPELDPKEEMNDDLEAMIRSALEVETDPWWRDRLTGGKTTKARQELYDSWLEARSPLGV